MKVKWKQSKNSDGVSEFGINPTDGKRPTDLSLRDIKRKTKRYKPTCSRTPRTSTVFLSPIYAGSGKDRFWIWRTCKHWKSDWRKQESDRHGEDPGETFCGQRFIPASRHVAFNLNKWLQLIGRDADNPFHWRRSKRHASSICILQPGLSRRAEKPLFVLRQTIPTRSTSTAYESVA